MHSALTSEKEELVMNYEKKVDRLKQRLQENKQMKKQNDENEARGQEVVKLNRELNNYKQKVQGYQRALSQLRVLKQECQKLKQDNRELGRVLFDENEFAREDCIKGLAEVKQKLHMFSEVIEYLDTQAQDSRKAVFNKNNQIGKYVNQVRELQQQIEEMNQKNEHLEYQLNAAQQEMEQYETLTSNKNIDKEITSYQENPKVISSQRKIDDQKPRSQQQRSAKQNIDQEEKETNSFWSGFSSKKEESQPKRSDNPYSNNSKMEEQQQKRNPQTEEDDGIKMPAQLNNIMNSIFNVFDVTPAEDSPTSEKEYPDESQKPDTSQGWGDEPIEIEESHPEPEEKFFNSSQQKAQSSMDKPNQKPHKPIAKMNKPKKEVKAEILEIKEEDDFFGSFKMPKKEVTKTKPKVEVSKVALKNVDPPKVEASPKKQKVETLNEPEPTDTQIQSHNNPSEELDSKPKVSDEKPKELLDFFETVVSEQAVDFNTFSSKSKQETEKSPDLVQENSAWDNELEIDISDPEDIINDEPLSQDQDLDGDKPSGIVLDVEELPAEQNQIIEEEQEVGSTPVDSTKVQFPEVDAKPQSVAPAACPNKANLEEETKEVDPPLDNTQEEEILEVNENAWDDPDIDLGELEMDAFDTPDNQLSEDAKIDEFSNLSVNGDQTFENDQPIKEFEPLEPVMNEEFELSDKLTTNEPESNDDKIKMTSIHTQDLKESIDQDDNVESTDQAIDSSCLNEESKERESPEIISIPPEFGKDATFKISPQEVQEEPLPEKSKSHSPEPEINDIVIDEQGWDEPDDQINLSIEEFIDEEDDTELKQNIHDTVEEQPTQQLDSPIKKSDTCEDSDTEKDKNNMLNDQVENTIKDDKVTDQAIDEQSDEVIDIKSDEDSNIEKGVDKNPMSLPLSSTEQLITSNLNHIESEMSFPLPSHNSTNMIQENIDSTESNEQIPNSETHASQYTPRGELIAYEEVNTPEDNEDNMNAEIDMTGFAAESDSDQEPSDSHIEIIESVDTHGVEKHDSDDLDMPSNIKNDPKVQDSETNIDNVDIFSDQQPEDNSEEPQRIEMVDQNHVKDDLIGDPVDVPLSPSHPDVSVEDMPKSIEIDITKEATLEEAQEDDIKDLSMEKTPEELKSDQLSERSVEDIYLAEENEDSKEDAFPVETEKEQPSEEVTNTERADDEVELSFEDLGITNPEEAISAEKATDEVIDDIFEEEDLDAELNDLDEAWGQDEIDISDPEDDVLNNIESNFKNIDTNKTDEPLDSADIIGDIMDNTVKQEEELKQESNLQEDKKDVIEQPKNDDNEIKDQPLEEVEENSLDDLEIEDDVWNHNDIIMDDDIDI